MLNEKQKKFKLLLFNPKHSQDSKISISLETSLKLYHLKKDYSPKTALPPHSYEKELDLNYDVLRIITTTQILLINQSAKDQKLIAEQRTAYLLEILKIVYLDQHPEEQSSQDSEATKKFWEDLSETILLAITYRYKASVIRNFFIHQVLLASYKGDHPHKILQEYLNVLTNITVNLQDIDVKSVLSAINSTWNKIQLEITPLYLRNTVVSVPTKSTLSVIAAVSAATFLGFPIAIPVTIGVVGFGACSWYAFSNRKLKRALEEQYIMEVIQRKAEQQYNRILNRKDLQKTLREMSASEREKCIKIQIKFLQDCLEKNLALKPRKVLIKNQEKEVYSRFHPLPEDTASGIQSGHKILKGLGYTDEEIRELQKSAVEEKSEEEKKSFTKSELFKISWLKGALHNEQINIKPIEDIRKIYKNTWHLHYVESEIFKLSSKKDPTLIEKFSNVAADPKFCGPRDEQGIKPITGLQIKGVVKINGKDVEVIFTHEMKLRGTGKGLEARILCYQLPKKLANKDYPLLIAGFFDDAHDLQHLAETNRSNPHRAPDLSFPVAAEEKTPSYSL